MTVYATFIATINGNSVEIIDGDVETYATMMYSIDNATWSASATPVAAGDEWYGSLDFTAGGYTGNVIITWSLERWTGSSWSNMTEAALTSDQITLTGGDQTVYASSDGAWENLHDFGFYISLSGTYRISADVASVVP